MGLLTPAFLAGLAALAVPLLIHLIRRERHDAVEFPSLMFLSRIPQPTVKRRRIRNWWLFALRCLALILLVGAFARPFVASAPVAIGGVNESREVVILLDRSYSMGQGDRWTRATAAAREAIDALDANDRASLVLFDASARAVTQPTTEVVRLRAGLDDAKPGAGVTRYTPALKLAQNILSSSELAQREVVLISDFQRAGWDGAAGVQLPTGTELRPVMIGGDVANLVITDVQLTRSRVSGLERVMASVQLANHGDAAAILPVVLNADRREIDRESVVVPAHGTARLELGPVTLGDQPMRASVAAGDDALPIDNAFHFVLAPDPGLRVLIVEPSGRDASLYLRQALELADEPAFQVSVKRDGMPTAAELQRTDVLVLNDVLPPAGDVGRRVVEWANAGGGVVMALGDRTATTTWSDNARTLAGGAPDRVIDRLEQGGARLGYLDYSHPVFELFRAPRAGAFGGARFYRYRPVPTRDVTEGDTAAARAAILARFDDGTAALKERPQGSGRVLVWGSTLDALWNNLAVEPIYLPLVHQVVRRAAGFEPPRPWSVAGQVVDVGSTAGEDLVVTTPSGARIDVQQDRPLLNLEEQGFYEVRRTRAGGGTLRAHAVNVDVSESDLTPLDPQVVQQAVITPVDVQRATGPSELPPEEQEKRQALWWYLLMVVFGLLVAEAVFANRRSVRPA